MNPVRNLHFKAEKIILLLFFLLILTPRVTSGVGIAVSPPQIDLQADANKKTSTQLKVANPAADVQLFEVYADDFSNFIKANPTSFTLEAGEEKTVVITFEGISKNAKKIQTNISVVAKPLAESRFQANSGVKIPITISVNPAHKSQFPVWILFLFVAGAILTFVSYYKIRNKLNLYN